MFSDEVSERGVELVFAHDGGGDIFQIEERLALSVFAQVEAALGGAPGDGGADVDVVGVAICACSEHGVGVDYRVGFAPGYLLAEARSCVALIGRAGPGGDAAHSFIGVCLADRLLRIGFVDPLLAPVPVVERAHAQRGGNADFCSFVGEHLGEFQACIAQHSAAVDVGVYDGDEFVRLVDLGHSHEDRHCHSATFALFAVQHGLFVFA